MPEVLLADDSASAPFMPSGGVTSRPVGHHEFCKRYAPECSIRTGEDARVRLTSAGWKDLVAVNTEVNRTITAVTDAELFGREEVWVYPTAMGDCEDFVLLKRRQLIERGWPVGALLVTVVRQANGDGHAVLTVLTDRGDLVLDNLDPQVKLWNQTDYRYLKRQSQFDTGRWVAIDDARMHAVGSLTR